MTRRLILRDLAEADIRDAYEWYETEEEGVGETFLAAVRASLTQILFSPYRFPLVHENRRRKLLHPYPYALYFKVEGDDVTIVACCHTRRDPEVWQSRT